MAYRDRHLPVHRDSRQPSAIALYAAALSLLLGVAIMAAWHLRLTAIIQVLPGSPPIRYNTALAFALSGLSLGLAQRQRRQPWALVLGGLVLAIGGLTLVQYLLEVDLGIDQLFMHDYLANRIYRPGQGPNPSLTESVQQFFITVDRPLPGRPSPNTALAFSLVGVALVGLGGTPPRRQPQWAVALAGVLAAGAMGIGLVALLGYITELGTAHTWRYLTGVSIPTAVGLLVLGVGLFSQAQWLSRSRGMPPWFPLSLGFGLLLASVFIWQALLSWENNLGAYLPEFAGELTALLTPVANLVLLAGVVLALLMTGILYADQRVKAQADRLRQLNDTLEEARSALDAILEATADGILVLTADRQVAHFNQRFARLWGLPSELIDAVRRGGPQQHFYAFVLEQIQEPTAFDAASQAMMADLGSKTFDRVELRDGRVFECYGRPQWQGGRPVAKVLSYRDVTDRYRAETALRDSEERYRSLVAALAEGVVLQDATGAIQTCNARAEEILGLTLDQMQGRTSIDPLWRSVREDGSPFPGDQHPAMVALGTGQPCRNVTMGIHRPDGRLTWLLVNAQPILHPGAARPHAVVTSFTDITQRKQMEEALFHEKELAQVTLQSIGDAVITTDVAGRIEYINPIAEALTGWSQAEAQGQRLADIFTILHQDTRRPVPNPLEQALVTNQAVALERDTVLIARDGREIGIDDSAAPIRDRQGKTVGAVLVFHDVTQARQLTRQVSWQAQHDPLTGLVNRREFEQRLAAALQGSHAQGNQHALCYLDLDQFKIVNDTCGHRAGDELLRQVTTLLQAHVRKTDTLARLGGDEFGVLLHQCPLDHALRVANLLRQAVQAYRFSWQGNTFAIGVSIGVATIDGRSEGLEQLLIAADAACYAAKNNGRNRVHVFQADDADLVQQQGEMRWATRLSQALEEDRFCLFAQPIAATAPQTDAAPHYEVLLRLRDEAGALVPPMAFLPAAERYGLMVAIDRWVVTTLFQHWATIQAADRRGLYAINLSGASINDDQTIGFLRQSLAQYAVAPELVCFEITETVAIANLSKASHFIGELRALGCRFALDDFGSGMSSFAYLKNLPVDYLKIDGSFVKDMLDDPVDEAMVQAINHIGQVLGLKTIAEYVENSAILERIAALGVDFAQGYGIAEPTPLTCSHPAAIPLV